MSSLLVNVSTLKQLILKPKQSILIADCRFDLTSPNSGFDSFVDSHIPSAMYIHLEKVLSGEKTGHNGRHPLPLPNDFLQWVQQAGIVHDTLVVAMDNNEGIFAARLWWLLRWIGHTNVCLLDGGWSAWLASNGDIETGPGIKLENSKTIVSSDFITVGAKMPTVTIKDVMDNIQTRQFQLIDARAPDRFAGNNETLDPVAGHIPNAINRFFKHNLLNDGRFKAVDVLRQEFELLLSERISAREIVHQCGSGVTACHNVFSMELAGLSGSLLYPGSWSEYCANSSRPMWKGSNQG